VSQRSKLAPERAKSQALLRALVIVLSLFVLLAGVIAFAMPQRDALPFPARFPFPQASPVHSAGATNPVTAAESVAVTVREGASAPPGCGEDRVVARVTSFLDAVRSGTAAVMAESFVESPIASVDDRPNGEFRQLNSRDAVVDYYLARHRAGEELRLLRITVGYDQTYDAFSVEANFGMEIERKAPGLRGLMLGKGVLTCDSGRIRVWNTGQTRL
jgi:hypothetical protein